MELEDLTPASTDLIDVPLMFNEEGEPTHGFKVVGANSEEYQKTDKQWRVKNIRKSAHRGRAVEAASVEGATEIADSMINRDFAICKACIKEIYGFLNGGVPAPLNDATLMAIFSKRPTWRTKIVHAIEAENVFSKASSGPGASETQKEKSSQTVA